MALDSGIPAGMTAGCERLHPSMENKGKKMKRTNSFNGEYKEPILKIISRD